MKKRQGLGFGVVLLPCIGLIALGSACSSSSSTGSEDSGVGTGTGTGKGSSSGSGTGTAAGSSTGSGTGTSSGTGTGAGSSTGSGTGGSGTGTGSGTGSGTGTGSGSGTGCGGVELTIYNYLHWCNVSVDGTLEPLMEQETICVGAAPVNVTAVNQASFIWGSWEYGTASTQGTGSDHATTATVTSGTACIVACCPDPGQGAASCYASNPCP